MGKLRTARRNPKLTLADLKYAGPSMEVYHEGTALTVQECRNSGQGRTWMLVSDQGVEYSAITGEDGALYVGVTGRVLSLV